jgi:hypothetical protein
VLYLLCGKSWTNRYTKKGSLPALRSFDSDSHVVDESDLDQEKHLPPKISTGEGRMISTKPVPRNPSVSIGDNLDPDSNLTEDSELKTEKHSAPTFQSMKEE